MLSEFLALECKWHVTWRFPVNCASVVRCITHLTWHTEYDCALQALFVDHEGSVLGAINASVGMVTQDGVMVVAPFEDAVPSVAMERLVELVDKVRLQHLVLLDNFLLSSALLRACLASKILLDCLSFYFTVLFVTA